MGQKTLDEATPAGLDSVTKPMQVFAAGHPKPSATLPWHWLGRVGDGGRRPSCLAGKRVTGAGKGRSPYKQKGSRDEGPASDMARHLYTSPASVRARAETARREGAVDRDAEGHPNVLIIRPFLG